MATASNLASEKYLAFTSFRKSGDRVSNPVWVVPLDDGRLGFWTALGSGKTKRLKNNPKVIVAPSDVRGRVKPGAESFEGTAEMVHSGPAFDEVHAKVKAKYGIQTTLSKLAGAIPMKRKGITYADTAVLITLG